MFILVTISDIMRIPPSHFENQIKAVEYEVNKKFMNKVTQDVGLFIALYDILSIKEGFVYPNDGGSHVRVKFRLVTFRPSKGEVFTGKIIGCSDEGVQVSIGFFENIYITSAEMQPNSEFDEKRGLWIWLYSTEEGEQHELEMGIGEHVRLRVDRIEFSPPTLTKYDPNEENEEEFVRAPMLVFGSVRVSGLGMVSWWDQTNEDEEEPDKAELEDFDEEPEKVTDDGKDETTEKAKVDAMDTS